MELVGRGGEGRGGWAGKGAEEERGKERGKKPKVEHKKYGCGFERGIFGGKKKPEQNHILLDTRDKSLLFRLLKLGKRRDGKRKKKAFFVVTLVESS